jgi:hypothetical protein
MRVSARKAFIAGLACDHFTEVPAISIGLREAFSSSRAARTSARSGDRRGAAVLIGGSRASDHSHWPMKTSIGISRKAGPGMPDTAWRMPSSAYSAMRWVW